MIKDKNTNFDIIVCPVCRNRVNFNVLYIYCVNEDCPHSSFPFRKIDGRPVLVDFSRSIIDQEHMFRDQAVSIVPRLPSKGFSFRRSIRKLFRTNNKAASWAADRMIEHLAPKGRLLIIGAGEIGNGMDALYADSKIDLWGLDIYASETVDVIGDAHQLPFSNESFDAVWIQAVLEHVLDPQQVVNEIWRVLKGSGRVFSSTPFMQQVHEGAFDFYRPTLSGHRWWFRRFEETRSGVAIGSGTALVWSIRYFLAAITGNLLMGKILSAPLSLLSIFDRIGSRHADGASVTYFFGTKADTELTVSEIVSFYENNRN